MARCLAFRSLGQALFHRFDPLLKLRCLSVDEARHLFTERDKFLFLRTLLATEQKFANLVDRLSWLLRSVIGGGLFCRAVPRSLACNSVVLSGDSGR
ncbi:MAG: hypothetical protein AAFO70_05915, partial [Pseudomonadota bacterium]